ncbi:MAG: NAD-dependent deacylase [Armatimonas sp.]
MSTTITPLGVGTRYRRVVVLTGAGVSVASGLPTYRGPGGLWETAEIAQIVQAESIPSRLPELWALYSERRRVALSVGPNSAHIALANVSPEFLTLITQNIDNLHQRAGSENVLELHGSGFRTRCTICALSPFDDETVYDDMPHCPNCGAPLRPDVVLFGELLDQNVIRAAKRALSQCDLFLAIGTSGVVWPAAGLVVEAHYAGARCLYVNVEPSEDPNPYFHEEIIGPAEEVLPVLLTA